MVLTGKAKWATILCKKNRPGLSNFGVKGDTHQGKAKDHYRGVTELGRSPDCSIICPRMLLRVTI